MEWVTKIDRCLYPQAANRIGQSAAGQLSSRRAVVDGSRGAQLCSLRFPARFHQKTNDVSVPGEPSAKHHAIVPYTRRRKRLTGAAPMP